MENNLLWEVNLIKDWVDNGQLEKVKAYDLIMSSAKKYNEMLPQRIPFQEGLKIMPCISQKKELAGKEIKEIYVDDLSTSKPKKKLGRSQMRTWKKAGQKSYLFGKWTEEEDDILRSDLEATAKSYETKLNRSRAAIQQRLWHLRTIQRKKKQQVSPISPQKRHERYMKSPTSTAEPKGPRCAAYGCNGAPEEGEIFCPGCLEQMQK